MISNPKQEISSIPATDHDAYVLGFEQMILDLDDLPSVELIMKKLQYLGLHFNPFEENVTSECQEVMKSLKMTDHMHNPYLATNILLRLLDKTEEQLNKLKQ